jgi:sulfite reductase (NADPH) hemoprotein beta-component
VERLEDCPPTDESEEASALLAVGAKAEEDQLVVGPDLIEVNVSEGAVVPVKMREAMRAKGPSIRTDLGKQAGN